MALGKGAEWKAGIAVLAGLAILGGGLFLVSGGSDQFKDKSYYTIHFTNSGGIVGGSDVLLAGEKVGSVSSVKTVEVVEEGKTRLYKAVTVEVFKSAKVHTDSKVTVSKTVTGIVSLYMEYGKSGELATEETVLKGEKLDSFEQAIDRGSKLLEKGQEVLKHVDEVIQEMKKVVQDVRLDELQRKANLLLDDLNEVSTDLKKMVKDAREPVSETLANARDGSGHFKDLAAEVKTDWGELKPKVHDILDSTKDAAKTVKNIVEENREPVKSFLQELNDNVERVGPALEQVEVLGKEATEILIELRPKLRSSMDDAGQALQNFKATTEDLKTAPWKLINAPSGAESAFVHMAEAARHYVDSVTHIRRLIDDLDGLRRLGVLGDADKKSVVERLLLKLQESLRSYQQREKDLFSLILKAEK